MLTLNYYARLTTLCILLSVDVQQHNVPLCVWVLQVFDKECRVAQHEGQRLEHQVEVNQSCPHHE